MREDFTISDFGLVEAGIALPGKPRDIIDYARAEGIDEARVQTLLGHKVRWFHMDQESSDADLIEAAIEDLCARLHGRAWLSRVTHLIYAHTQAFSMPAPPESLLSDLLGRYEDLRPWLSFSVEHAACASAILALEWAARLLHGEGAPDALALVVTSDRVFGNASYRIRQNGGVQSDGASALLVGAQDLRCRFGGITVCTDDRLHEGPSSAGRQAAIARATWLQLRQMLREHSTLTGLDLRDAASILPVNADWSYWVKIANALNIGEEKFYFDGITQRGHACCADLAINLVDRGFALVDGGGWVVFCGQSNLGAHAALTLLPPAHSAAVHQTGAVHRAEQRVLETCP
jgi:3-oxoacyl-[acyl-carrier-protein] synthase III